MSQNNTIKKSDKKFIRTEKARIRRQFLDVKKQEELIDKLYEKFSGKPGANQIIDENTSVKKEAKKPKAPQQKQKEKKKGVKNRPVAK
ncbi:MAG: hypothetical protein A2908_02820 [Candidatus Staskawiczbacteria bacterium RIFCSPLOWO2_01_FULL_38_12b]|uniref:Uncharacterized protein n=1 Tax=Candidatus Staskawiczbacteria bacterium RIFCSPLOWO2_01_FULL_38_12b TaxID=1802214 RepID=A0A1G2ICP5_9BACT|nr:MAG: hypothetical protein A2908_02820 [Candidatus Staskawiczbacteria bacterium RIFCSPLOWO2_01_FULL_38_12b]